MFNGADAIGRQAHGNGLAQNFRWERANLQVWLPATAGLVIGVADIVAKAGLLAIDGTYTGHDHHRGRAPSFNSSCLLCGFAKAIWPDILLNPGGLYRRRG